MNRANALGISKRYSKGRPGQSKAGKWHSDAKSKHNMAGTALKKWAAEYLQPVFEKLRAHRGSGTNAVS